MGYVYLLQEQGGLRIATSPETSSDVLSCFKTPHSRDIMDTLVVTLYKELMSDDISYKASSYTYKMFYNAKCKYGVK